MRYLICDGIIADGTGAPCFVGSVLIEDGRIAAVIRGTDTQEVQSARESGTVVVDARGGYITPGFIDIHRHGDWMALTNGDDELLNRQGITSVVNGNCGLSAAPQGGGHERETEHFLRSFIGVKPEIKALKNAGRVPDTGDSPDPAFSMEEYLSCLRRVKRSVNTGILAGGGTVRAGVAGYSTAPLTGEQEEKIREKIQGSLDAGALGVSLGMGYDPEFGYDEESLARVLEPVRGRGIPIAVHIRTEGDGADEAVAEMIRVAKALDAPLHLSHMKCIGKRNWRRVCAKELEMIRRARSDGLEVSFDTYPYVTGSTQLVHLIPPEFQRGGPQGLMEYLKDQEVRSRITEALRKPSKEYENIVELVGFENIMATGMRSEEFAPLEGMTLARMAQERGRDPYDTLYDILLSERCEAAMLDTYGCEEDLVDYLRDEQCSLISDAIYPEGGRRHPRVYDSFPRFLIRYVRERRVFSIEEAVRKMTSLPASVYGLDRGILAPGRIADLCVFRLENLQTQADFAHPDRMCRGFDYVFTQGEPCLIGNRWVNTGSGTVL